MHFGQNGDQDAISAALCQAVVPHLTLISHLLSAVSHQPLEDEGEKAFRALTLSNAMSYHPLPRG